MTDKPNDRRLDLDAIDERVNAEIAAEREAASAIVATMPKPEPVEETPEVERLREENERLMALINQTLDARKRARDFMTIWSDPRRLPDLIHEVYMSHPNVQDIKEKLGEEYAKRAARLIAHMGLTYELHPLMPGMIYAWEQDKKLMVEVGYRGYSEMVERDGMDYEAREMTPEEREKHGLAPKDRGWLCFIHDWERVDRFLKRGLPAPEPYRGVGIWKNQNARNKPDNIPASKSGDWVAEKNALKAAGRFALSASVTKTAKPDAIDFVFSQNEDAWVMPVEVATWLSYPGMLKRFEALLDKSGVAEEDFNAFLGHNWRYTMLEAEEIKVKFDAYLAQRDGAIEGVFEAKPAEVPAKPEPEVSPEQDAKPAEEGAVPTVFDQPAAKKREGTRRQPIGEKTEKPAEAAPVCLKCEKNAPSGEEPFPFLCPDCARTAADEQAAKEAA